MKKTLSTALVSIFVITSSLNSYALQPSKDQELVHQLINMKADDFRNLPLEQQSNLIGKMEVLLTQLEQDLQTATEVENQKGRWEVSFKKWGFGIAVSGLVTLIGALMAETGGARWNTSIPAVLGVLSIVGGQAAAGAGYVKAYFTTDQMEKVAAQISQAKDISAMMKEHIALKMKLESLQSK